MINVSKTASKEIHRQFVSQSSTAIRIAELSRGGNGPILHLVRDTPKQTDRVQHEDGFDLIVNRCLEDELGGIRIEYAASPFGGGNFTIGPLVNLTCGGCGDCRC